MGSGLSCIKIRRQPRTRHETAANSSASSARAQPHTSTHVAQQRSAARIIHLENGRQIIRTVRPVGVGGGAVIVTCPGANITDLILDTLRLLRNLDGNDQEPPLSLLQLHRLAEEENGWINVVESVINVIPADDPLGPAVITLLLDECPLPTKEAVEQLCSRLSLAPNVSPTEVSRHCNTCVALGCLAAKMAGPGSQLLFSDKVFQYLLSHLSWDCAPLLILHSIVALEKFAQTSENKIKIIDELARENPVKRLVSNHDNSVDLFDFVKRQVSFCARWTLDNLLVPLEWVYSYKTVDLSGINAMLNGEDVSEYLKLSSDGLEARCDASSFESVRCTFEVSGSDCWYYEVEIVTAGIMQIGWATKHSKFLNHEGYGIGDDEYSVAYDGCRQLIWFGADGIKHPHPCWKSGDVLGVLLDLNHQEVIFSLNGNRLPPFKHLFRHTSSGFFAAASFMSFQQCRFNFGSRGFRFPPSTQFNNFNDFGQLSPENKVILPRPLKLALLRQVSVRENSCTVCADNVADTMLMPCEHRGFCGVCAIQLSTCPLCRQSVTDRQPDVTS